jgi:hypothetical protein
VKRCPTSVLVVVMLSASGLAQTQKPANWNVMSAAEQAQWLCRDDPSRITARCKMVPISSSPDATSLSPVKPTNENLTIAKETAQLERCRTLTGSAYYSCMHSSANSAPSSSVSNNAAYQHYLTTKLSKTASDGSRTTRHFTQSEWETYCFSHRSDSATCQGWMPGATADTGPSAQVGQQEAGMSTKKKVIIGSLVGAAIAGAVTACIKSDGCGSGGGPASSPSSDSNQNVFPRTPELLLFGGKNHKVFLGCLNCSEFDTGSIFNQFGDHGSRFGSESIFNRFSDYGSAYSSHSVCNKFASDPPIVVDRAGNAYGRLTLNQFAYQVNDPQVIAWLTSVCQS